MNECKCKNCNKDIGIASNSIDWRIKLENDEIKYYTPVVTDMMIYPNLEESPLYFCNIGCLLTYLKLKFPKIYENIYRLR